MPDTFRCTIVTPSEAVFDEDVSYVSFPAWDGQQGVMVHQSPILSRLGIGLMRIDRPGGESGRGESGRGGSGSRLEYWIDGGFAQVHGSVLTILTERAVRPEDLTGEDTESELREANARAVSGGGTSADDRRKVEAAQQRARSKLALQART